jgi:hypothetical protein
MSDGTGLAEQLLGLDGFKVLGVTEGEHELVIAVETTASVTGCWSCGVLAECQDRVRADIRDLAWFGRPAPACDLSPRCFFPTEDKQIPDPCYLWESCCQALRILGLQSAITPDGIQEERPRLTGARTAWRSSRGWRDSLEDGDGRA